MCKLMSKHSVKSNPWLHACCTICCWQTRTPVLHGRQEACRVFWQALQCIVGKGRLSHRIHIDILSGRYLTNRNLRIMHVCSDRASHQSKPLVCRILCGCIGTAPLAAPACTGQLGCEDAAHASCGSAAVSRNKT